MAKTVEVDGVQYEVKVKHYRLEGSYHFLTNVAEVWGCGGATRVTLARKQWPYHGISPTYTVVVAWTFCSPDDQFSREAGRRIATERAVAFARGVKDTPFAGNSSSEAYEKSANQLAWDAEDEIWIVKTDDGWVDVEWDEVIAD